MTVDQVLREMIRDEIRAVVREELRVLREENLAMPKAATPVTRSQEGSARDPASLLSTKDVAAYCGVTEPTVRVWISSGELSAERLHRQYRIRRPDLDAFMAGRAVAPSKVPEVGEQVARIFSQISSKSRAGRR